MANNQKSLNNDEILIKDIQGNFKIWQNHHWQDFSLVIPIKGSAMAETMIDSGFVTPFLPPPHPILKKTTLDNQGFYPPKDIISQEKLLQKKYGINKIINKVIEVLALKLDLETRERFKKILFSYCRQARSLIDVLEIFQQPKETGGLDFKLIDAERIMAIVKNIVSKINQEGGLIINEGDWQSMTKPIPPVETGFKPVETGLKPVSTGGQAEPKASESKLISIKPRAIEETTFPKVIRPITERAKQITEVKKRSMILGPVEELATFTLTDFRRLASDLKQRVNKILKKIETLATESITKKVFGIKAWRQSPVHRQYLAIGEESIKQGKSVNQIIEEKLRDDTQFLTIAEFEVLADLSRKLRF